MVPATALEAGLVEVNHQTQNPHLEKMGDSQSVARGSEFLILLHAAVLEFQS